MEQNTASILMRKSEYQMAVRIETDYNNVLVLQDANYGCFACHARKRVLGENIESSRMRCELPVETLFVIYRLPVV